MVVVAPPCVTVSPANMPDVFDTRRLNPSITWLTTNGICGTCVVSLAKTPVATSTLDGGEPLLSSCVA